MVRMQPVFEKSARVYPSEHRGVSKIIQRHLREQQVIKCIAV
jgi:hypothetical protein